MKSYNVIILLCLLPVLLFSQAAWDESGVAVRQGEYIDWERKAVSFDNEIVYVWTDCRRGDRDVWAQKIDDQGNKLWDEDVLVCGETFIQKDIVITFAGDDAIIIAWFDKRYDYEGDIFAQKLDLNGEILWNPAGIPICVNDEPQKNLNIATDGNGGAFVIWDDSRNAGGTDIYGIHILEDGETAPGWETNGNAVNSEPGDQEHHSICSDGSGGAIVVWHDERNTDNHNIYMQRILSGGSLAWDEAGLVLCDAPSSQDNPQITIGSDLIFTIVWRDKRNDFFGDIYLQKIFPDGQILLPEDLCVSDAYGAQRNPNLVSINNDETVVVWEDGRNESSNDYYDIYAQKIGVAGNSLWEANGVSVVMANHDQTIPSLLSDNNGGCWIVWEDGRIENHPFGDIYLQHLDTNGISLLNVNGLLVCDASNRQFYPILTLCNNNIVLIWQDQRNGSDDIFSQTIDQNGNVMLLSNGVSLQEGISGDAYDHKLLANGDNPILVWKDTRNHCVADQLFIQIINPDGSFFFIDDGIPITTETGFNQQNADAVFNSESDDVVVVWQENRSEFNKVYAEAVDLTGNSVWNPEGISLCSEEIEQYNSQIDYSEGFYYTGWTDYNGDWENPVIKVSGQKINTDGNLLWGDSGVVISELPGDDMITDIVGRYYIWQNENWPEYKIYAKLVNEDGSTADGWPDNGLLICNEPGTQIKPRGFLTSNGLLVIWKDTRTQHEEVYGQLVTTDGEIQWQENGVPLATNEYDANQAKLTCNDDNFYLIWQNYNGDLYDIYMQKFDYSGNFCWDEVVQLGTNNTPRSDPDLVLCEDKIYATWIEMVGYYDHVKAQLLDENGNKLWIPGGEIVCESIYGRNHPKAVYNGSDHVYSAWIDDRDNDYMSLYNLYTQKMYVGQTGISNDQLPVTSYQLSNYPNPFNPTTTITFSLNTEIAENTELVIYNLKGQKVKQLVSDQLVAGQHSVVWNGLDDSGKSVSSGVYFYKLKSGDFEKTKKMLLLK
jgi:FlgD Ig-like domain